MNHNVKFERNIFTGQWRALCTDCLWMMQGEKGNVQNYAGLHDLEWQEVKDVTAHEAGTPTLRVIK
jgi:hypothetical protein